ncbi:hypothetical protein [Pseudomonas sp.]|uniref:hypothetical protein n=1 Tax=Pseudomonas sp. TaxID=306 RepID=UPI00333EE7B9
MKAMEAAALAGFIVGVLVGAICLLLVAQIAFFFNPSIDRSPESATGEGFTRIR